MIEIDFESLGSIGLTPYIAQQLLQLETATADVFSARIVEIHGEWMLAHSGQSEYRVRALPTLGFGLAVGDWVIVHGASNANFTAHAGR
jgi:hypothetical protein